MKCLETRTTAEGYKRRRYATAAGHRFSTIEIPLEVWVRVNGVGRQRDRAAQANRALEREGLRRQALALCAAGRTPRDASAALGVPKRTIQRWVAARG